MLNKVKLALAIMIVGAITYTGVLIKNLRGEIKELNIEVARQTNNAEAYQGMYGESLEEGRVLRLKKIDLAMTNNKLLMKLDSIARSKKIKVDKPGTIAAGGSTEINDTASVKIKNDSGFKMDTTVVHNNHTSVRVQIAADSLSTTLKVNNFVSFFVYPSIEYRNQYKNFFRRLIKFDFKKVENTRYSMDNENELIKTTGFAVYKIEE